MQHTATPLYRRRRIDRILEFRKNGQKIVDLAFYGPWSSSIPPVSIFENYGRGVKSAYSEELRDNAETPLIEMMAKV